MVSIVSVEKTVIKADEQEQQTLHFDVYLFDGVADELKVGNYNVLSSGAVECTIDDYFQLQKKYNNKVQDIMLENGLREIMDLQISDDELFKNLLAGKYSFETDENRWTKANEYVVRNNLKVDTLEVPLKPEKNK